MYFIYFILNVFFSVNDGHSRRLSLLSYMCVCMRKCIRRNTQVAGKSWRYALWHWNWACWNFPVVFFLFVSVIFSEEKNAEKNPSWSWVYVCVCLCLFFFSSAEIIFASYSFIEARRVAYTSQKSFNIDRRAHSVWLAQALPFFCLNVFLVVVKRKSVV